MKNDVDDDQKKRLTAAKVALSSPSPPPLSIIAYAQSGLCFINDTPARPGVQKVYRPATSNGRYDYVNPLKIC